MCKYYTLFIYLLEIRIKESIKLKCLFIAVLVYCFFTENYKLKVNSSMLILERGYQVDLNFGLWGLDNFKNLYFKITSKTLPKSHERLQGVVIVIIINIVINNIVIIIVMMMIIIIVIIVSIFIIVLTVVLSSLAALLVQYTVINSTLSPFIYDLDYYSSLTYFTDLISLSSYLSRHHFYHHR